MNARNLILVRGAIVLLVLWAVVFSIAKFAGSRKPTMERIIAYQENNPLSEIEDPDERKEVIGKLADMLNQMEATEVGRLAEREDRDPRREFFRELTPEEQMFFLEKRVGRAFEQMMESFNQMGREERQRIVENALRQMKENRGGPRDLEQEDREIVEKITTAGLKAYYSEASVETKIDLAPLMEEMQGAMSRMGRPKR